MRLQQTMNNRRCFAQVCMLLVAATAALMRVEAGDTYKWTVQYLIDNSQTILGQSQKVWPRRNRGLALSLDGKYLYAGYHHGAGGGGEVRKIALSINDDFARATVRILPGPLGKAIACDDLGRVYISGDGDVHVYDSGLNARQHTIPLGKCEGLAVAREGKELALYASDRDLGVIHRYVLEEEGDDVTGSAPGGFDGSGTVSIPDAGSLRGLEIDAKGALWVADPERGRIFRVSEKGKTIEHTDVPNAMDIALVGNRVYVTRGRDRLIAVLDAGSMQLIGNLAVPWEELELNPAGNNRMGALGGIVAIPGKGFFVANESGQTAGQRSTYGRADDNTDFVEGKLFRDAYNDDNDPILRALEVQEAP